MPTEISGGQAQRVQMARAFLYPSEVMLLDEPFKGLDVSLKNPTDKKFLELWGRDGRTVVLVTHDVYDALLMGDKVFVLSGSPADIVYETELTVEKVGKKPDRRRRNEVPRRNRKQNNLTIIP
ncbi:MAG: ATP-binding cassette domain-containing protein [Clostridiales bacterium]|nr:MAG: ATP-binding cassette domain-containing protein [Clostridiales bacterium]